MYFVLGLLAAGLVALLVTPVLWRRAERLAQRRVEAALPSTRAEINADKDQLRARFAVTNRRLEMAISRLNEKLAGRLIEVGEQKDEIGALNRRQAELTENVATLEKRDAEITASLRVAENRVAAANSEVTLRDERLAARAAEIGGLRANIAEHEQLGEEQRLELVARATTIDNLTDRLTAAAASETLVVFARDQLQATLANERARLAETQRHVQSLEISLAELQAERIERIAELGRRAEEIAALEAELAAERVQLEAMKAANEEARDNLADAARRIGVLEAGLDAVRAERVDRQAELDRHAAALKARDAEIAAERERREALAAALDTRTNDIAASNAGSGAIAINQRGGEAAATAMDAKKTALARVTALEAEIGELRAENIELRHVAGAEWESDREQTKRLRERLNEIAADVVSLTKVMTKANAPVAENGNSAAHAPAAPATAPTVPPRIVEPPGASGKPRSLGERLRALQHANVGR